MKKRLNLEYGSLHGTYYLYYASMVGFASVYLLARGYTSSDIGIILALGNIIPVVLETILADYADRKETTAALKANRIMSYMLLAFTVAILFFPGKSGMLSLLFILANSWFFSVQPLINALAFSISKEATHINFSAGRAVGSLLYAVLSFFLGSLVEKFGADIIIYVSIISAILFILVQYLLKHDYLVTVRMHNGTPYVDREEELEEEELDALKLDENRITIKEFVKRNPWFFLLMFSVIFLFFSNSGLCNFLIQIVDDVGGDAVDMGKIAAFMGLLEIPSMLFYEKINAKISTRKLIVISGFGYAFKTLLYYLASSVLLLYLAQLAQLIAFALFLPACIHFIDEVMSEGEAVKGQALFTIMVSVGCVLANAVCGYAIDFLGVKNMILICLGAAILGLVIILIALPNIHKREN
ncbi:MAG: MFS transporter [Clostridia bacterium]|nr:MFS transporter [Clostridia bacterium]